MKLVLFFGNKNIVVCVAHLSPRHCARGQHISFRKNVAAVASRWQHYVWFDQGPIRDLNLSPPAQEMNVLPLDTVTVR